MLLGKITYVSYIWLHLAKECHSAVIVQVCSASSVVDMSVVWCLSVLRTA